MPPSAPALLPQLRSKGLAARAWWGGLGHYWQHFIVAILLGVAIEAAIHAAHNLSLVKRVQNAVLDTSLRVFSTRDKPDSAAQPMPVLLVLDDVSTQSPQWGQDQSTTLAQALQLVGHAFDRGSRHVLLDITFDTEPASLMPEQQAALQAFAKRYASATPEGPRHLYVARSARVDPCFPRNEAAETLRPSAWEALVPLDVAQRPGLVIHSVLPHYRADPDSMVRGWDLFGVLKAPTSPQKESAPTWRFLPSPQLAHQVVTQTPVDQLAQLPWLDTAQTQPSGVSRAAFAADRVQRIPLLAAPSFSHSLCAHHPHTLGCAPTSLVPSTASTPLSPQQQLEQINALLKPLPTEHACRASAAERLNNGTLALPDGPQQDLLFNRIVYELPAWDQANSLAQRGYYLRTPLSLQDDALDWRGRLVAVGAADANSGDWHNTPMGRIPGVLINLNAMQSLERIGPVASPPTWLSLLLNGLIIVMVAAVFSALSPLAAATLSAALLIGSLAVFHQYLLSRGIWIEFGAPLIGINLHRIIDGFLAQRRLEAQLAHHQLLTPASPPHAQRTNPSRRRPKRKGP